MRWTIKRKLSLAFAFVAVMMTTGTAFEHWARTRAAATAQAITSTDSVLFDLEYLIAYVREVTVEQRAYLISGDEGQIADIPALRKDADAVAARVRAQIAGDAGQSEHFARYLEAVRQRRAVVNKLNSLRKEQGFDAAKTLFDTGEDTRLLKVIEDEFAAMKSVALAKSDELKRENDLVQLWTTRAEWISMCIAIVLLTAIAAFFIRSVVRNVQISLDLVGAMARKDLSVRDGKPVSNDEIGEAILAINRMKDSMAGTLALVAHSSQQVAAAGAQIEMTSREISSSSRQEQKNVEHFASSIAQMNASVQDVAEHAGRASEAANQAAATAVSGRDVVRQTQAAMERISTTVHTASSNIGALGQETQSIGEVVRIIEEIAGQTNLLALNAAIEAARAGEQGKGFAVVAQEVRQLAERTARFTKEIAVKVESVQHGASRAVQFMSEGEGVVNEGVGHFNRFTATLEAITERVEVAQQGIAMIATATTQQSEATSGLAENIHEISAGVAHGAEQLDQTVLACAELARLAGGLQQLVDGFQLAC